jgi:glycosyltransferase involved in cell wall biosynthesis
MEISVIVPIYNDGILAEDFCSEFNEVFQNYYNSQNLETFLELIFVNDGSKNESITDLKKLTEKYSYVKVIDLSRNFGQHIALSCGYKYAKGNFVAMLNVDMQEPPSQIIKLLDHIRIKNIEIVYGLVAKRKTSFLNRISSSIFNTLMNFLTQQKIPLNVSTLRIMSRKFINSYNEFSEKSRYLPGLENWLGFKNDFIPIYHQERRKGKSSYNFRKRLNMAFESIISFSDFPLRLIVMLGSIIALLGFILTTILIFSKILFINFQPGFTTTVSVITFLGGIQIIVVGVSALYIGRILKEVQNRPLYIINEKINFK